MELQKSRSPESLNEAPAVLVLSEYGGRQQRIGCVDPGGAEIKRYLAAPNLKRVVRKHKTGHIVEIHITPHGDDTKLPSHGGGQSLTYDESVAEQYQLPVLKIYDAQEDRFRKWGENDGFNSRGFNPYDLPRLHP